MRSKKQKNMVAGLWKYRRGITLIELVTTMVIAVIPISSVAVLVVGGQHSWGRTYLSANRKIKSDGEASCAFFSRIGRKSDCENTALITSSGNSILRSQGSIGPQSISASNSYGTGIEFRYWEQAQQSSFEGSRNIRASSFAGSTTEMSLTPTEYARFYLESDGKLKIDYGPYPYDTLTRRVDRTVVIAENVIKVEFNRTIENNAAQACVKMEITLKDPKDGKVLTLKTATLIRN